MPDRDPWPPNRMARGRPKAAHRWGRDRPDPAPAPGRGPRARAGPVPRHAPTQTAGRPDAGPVPSPRRRPSAPRCPPARSGTAGSCRRRRSRRRPDTRVRCACPAARHHRAPAPGPRRAWHAPRRKGRSPSGDRHLLRRTANQRRTEPSASHDQPLAGALRRSSASARTVPHLSRRPRRRCRSPAPPVDTDAGAAMRSTARRGPRARPAATDCGWRTGRRPRRRRRHRARPPP